MSKRQLGVVGAGAFGTAVASLMARKGHDVKMWAYEKETVDSINQHHVNAAFLPGAPLPENLTASSDLHEVVRDHEVLIMACPSHSGRSVLPMLPSKIRSPLTISFSLST